jgi:glycosyltransferase involved in cell wall biosynthesis
MISVCIATYNGAKYIKELLDSILCQLSEQDEVLISDDDSTDDTLNIIREINDKRITIFNHKEESISSKYIFAKITKNFENALSHAKGNYIFLVDQDDVWLEDKVEKVINRFNDDTLLILHDCYVVDKDKNIINNSYFNLNASRPGFYNNIINSSYLGCCMAFRKEILDVVLPFPSRPVPHDIWIGLLAEWKKRVLFLDQKLILYRRHDANLSTSSEKSTFSLKKKLSYRLILINALIKRIFF